MDKIKGFFLKYSNDIIKPIIVLLAICVVIPLALSVTNAATEKRIKKLEQEASNKAMQRLISAQSFEKKTFEAENGFEYYVAIKNKKTVGYIFTNSAKGYGGDVSIMTALDTDGKVKEIAILDVSNETPGLGQNANKKDFYSQFSNKQQGIELVKNGADAEKNQVDAVTGATITSKAVTACVNEALDSFKALNIKEDKTDETK